MTETTFTFRVDDELKEAFTQVAKAQDRTGAQLLRGFMRELVQKQAEAAAHDAWFRAEVEQGVREADDPAIERIPNEVIEDEWRLMKAELAKRAGR